MAATRNSPWAIYIVAQLVQGMPTATSMMVEDALRDIHQHFALRTNAHTESKCADDDAQIIALASGVGATISGCAEVQSYCDHAAYGSTVQAVCPATCGLCALGPEPEPGAQGPKLGAPDPRPGARARAGAGGPG